MGNALYFHRCELFTSFRNIAHIDEKSYAGFSNALCYRLVVFFHPYFVLFNSQVDELKKSQTSPSQRQTPIPFQVFKMFPVFMHTFIFDSILDTLKIVIPSFAVFSQWQIARASARVSIRFD